MALAGIVAICAGLFPETPGLPHYLSTLTAFLFWGDCGDYLIPTGQDASCSPLHSPWGGHASDTCAGDRRFVIWAWARGIEPMIAYTCDHHLGDCVCRVVCGESRRNGVTGLKKNRILFPHTDLVIRETRLCSLHRIISCPDAELISGQDINDCKCRLILSL